MYLNISTVEQTYINFYKLLYFSIFISPGCVKLSFYPMFEVEMKDNLLTIIVPTFLILLGLSLLLYMERIIILDNALHIIYCINTNEIGVMAGRWPTAIVRLPLWLAINNEVPLPLLLYVYSLSHVLLKILLISTTLIFRDLRSITLALVSYFLVVQHTFYWNVSELLPAILGIVILYGYLISRNTCRLTIKSLLVVFLLCTLSFFSHPLSFLGIVFLSFYLYLSKRQFIYILPALAGGLLYILKKLFFSNWYDLMKMEGLEKNISTYGHSISNIPSLSQIGYWLVTDFWMIIISFAIVALYLFFHKNYLKLLLLIASTLGTLLLFALSNPEKVNIFYAEASMYLISFYIGVVFVEDILTQVSKQRLYTLVISIIAIAILKIIYVLPYYSERVEYVNRIADSSTTNKLALLGQNINKSKLGLDWGLPFETMIASTLKEANTTKTVVTLDKSRSYKQSISNTNVLLNGIGGSYDIMQLDRYFYLNNSKYKVDSLLIIK